ncbi:hypothetical protein [Amycolatopsis kentuckyensis]|uniref:hypothetical protein n=1 Tax=Amycolatopsis kentuckyensis TaxID=218823 RepID=UPI00356A0D40
MLYRLRPPSNLTWCNLPGNTIELSRRHPEADFDRLPWAPTEARVFSEDLLRIAVRHGVSSNSGLVVDVRYTLDLGRADELRSGQLALDEAQANLRTSASMQMIEQMFPGHIESGVQLDEEVRASTEKIAREAEEDLADVLAAPVRQQLVEHWQRLGGHYPD